MGLALGELFGMGCPPGFKCTVTLLYCREESSLDQAYSITIVQEFFICPIIVICVTVMQLSPSAWKTWSL